jgi:ABC-2 type transport system ATP-binding protein
MAGAVLEAVGLTKRYGARTAVADVSFSGDQGDVVGLLGPNGAGKTTTIRLLTTVLSPTSGDFTVAGHPSTAPEQIRRRIGVLPESGGYPRHQTGRDYLRYYARLHGAGRRPAGLVADRLLADVGLADRGRSPISSYSRGMKRRLGIARALVNDPAVIFLDEPTIGLDPAGRSQVLGMVRRLARSRGTTVLLSTHTLPEVEETCSKVLVLAGGRVQSFGSVRDVIETAMVEPYAQLRVHRDLVTRAQAAVAGLSGFIVEQSDGQPDVLRITAIASANGRPTASTDLNAALVAVAEAGVPVLSYEVEGARLSDAFLKMTGGTSG